MTDYAWLVRITNVYTEESWVYIGAVTLQEAEETRERIAAIYPAPTEESGGKVGFIITIERED